MKINVAMITIPVVGMLVVFILSQLFLPIEL